jgi:hypothetical protein
MDIEASIQDDDALDIGVFGSDMAVTDEVALHMVNALVECLQGAVVEL